MTTKQKPSFEDVIQRFDDERSEKPEQAALWVDSFLKKNRDIPLSRISQVPQQTVMPFLRLRMTMRAVWEAVPGREPEYDQAINSVSLYERLPNEFLELMMGLDRKSMEYLARFYAMEVRKREAEAEAESKDVSIG